MGNRNKQNVCKGCLANGSKCALGFKIKIIDNDYRFNGQRQALESCPKPTTEKAYDREIRHMTNKKMGSKYA